MYRSDIYLYIGDRILEDEDLGTYRTRADLKMKTGDRSNDSWKST